MRFPRRGRTSLLAATALVAAAALAGCGGGSGGGNSKTVTIWSSVDKPVQDGLEKVLKDKVKADGITIKWQRVDNINQLIMQKIQANDTPDIAFIPQPGVVADIVKRGKGVPLENVVDMANLKTDMIPGTLDSGMVNGKLYGLLISANVKSLVFYPKKAFEAAGYTAPKSLDELQQLTDKIKADGKTPWCMGMESGAATGWAATDWMEDLVMRTGGPDVYKNWVSHKVKFDSPEVKAAANEMDKLLFTDGNVLGGRKSIASTAFGTAGNPMFDAKPGCFMYRQGSFITDFFPDNVKKDLDNQVGVFGFPPKEAGGDNPILGGGDMGMVLNDSANTKKVFKYLSEADIGNEAAGSSTFISPHKSFDASKYPNKVKAAAAAVGAGATELLFDGSDQMPGEVGSGSFWKEMTAWISGGEDLDTALKNIDSSWPAS